MKRKRIDKITYCRVNKRNAISKAALELFVSNGSHGTPMSEIALRANVSPRTIYLYFESKDALIQKLHQELATKIRTVIQKNYPSRKTLQERFFYIATTLLKYCISHPLDFRYTDQYQSSPYGASSRIELIMGGPDDYKPLKELFEEGIAKQEIRNRPLDIFVILAVCQLLDLAREEVLGFITLDDAKIMQVAEACWSLIKKH